MCIRDRFRAFAEIVDKAEKEVVVIDTAPTGHTLLLLDATESYHKEVQRTQGDTPASEMCIRDRNKAKDRIIRNVNQECMFRCTLLTSGNGQNVNAIDHIELNRYPSEAEIKKDGR